MQKIASKFQRIRQLPAADKLLVLRAALWLAYAHIKLALTPFRQLCESLAVSKAKTIEQVDPKYLTRIGYAVRAAANNVPWRSDCFPQTIAARMLLSHEGFSSTIHLGVEKSGEGGIAGHAWLTCGGEVVVGGEELDRYTEMHRFNA